MDSGLTLPPPDAVAEYVHYILETRRRYETYQALHRQSVEEVFSRARESGVNPGEKAVLAHVRAQVRPLLVPERMDGHEFRRLFRLLELAHTLGGPYWLGILASPPVLELAKAR